MTVLLNKLSSKGAYNIFVVWLFYVLFFIAKKRTGVRFSKTSEGKRVLRLTIKNNT
jgi:hypothetical protein